MELLLLALIPLFFMALTVAFWATILYVAYRLVKKLIRAAKEK